MKRLKRFLLILMSPILFIFILIVINKLYEAGRNSFLDTIQKQTEDIDRLAYVFKNEFAGYKVLQDSISFAIQIEGLKTLVEKEDLSSESFNLEVLKIVASFKDPHTAIVNTKQIINNYFPYRVTWSDGNFYLTSGVVDAKWLGAKVMRFNNTDSKTVYDILNRYSSSPNEAGSAYFMNLYQSNAYLLFHEKVIDSPDKIQLELKDENGKIGKVTFNSMSNEEVNQHDKYIRLSSNFRDNLPVWKRHVEKNYWFEYWPADKTMYLRYSMCVAQGDINVFWKELFDEIEQKKPEKFIIDLRGNPGGDTQNNVKFLNELSNNNTVNNYGKLFTIIDRATGSAAVSLASNLERLTNTIIVGEKTMDRPNTTSDPTYFSLPHSGIKISVPSLYHLNTYVFDERDAVIPKISINQLIDKQNYNQDQVLDSIRKINFDDNFLYQLSDDKISDKAIGKYKFSLIRNLEIYQEGEQYKIAIDGLLEGNLQQNDSSIFSNKYNIKVVPNDSLFTSIDIEVHGCKLKAQRINNNELSVIENINAGNFERLQKQISKLKSNGVLPYYLQRPFFQTTIYDLYVKDGFEKALELNKLAKSLFPNDPVTSIIDYELYQYNDETFGQIKSVFPIIGKVVKRYYQIVMTPKIMNDDYNPFIGK